MSEQESVRYFLGANTARGFYSLYDEFTGGEHVGFVWYIKGGPGNGKSTFMRRAAQAAEEAGYTVEYAMCSGDPGSLDGIYIRETRTAYVDATSPHVQEPSLPGATGKYIDLSAFYKKNAHFDKAAIRECFRQYREQYARAYSLLRAASLIGAESIPGLIDGNSRAAVRSLAREQALSLPEFGAGGNTRRLFLSAYTCHGPVFFPELLKEIGKVIYLHSSTGLESEFLREIGAVCKERELALICCPDPLDPDKPEGVLIPEAGLTFYTYHRGAKLPGNAVRHINLDRYIPEFLLSEHASEIRKCASLRSGLLRMATAALEKAKACHDELEALYHPTVDFAALDRFAKKHLKENI